MNGGDGHDFLTGEAGNDKLYGEAGDDYLNGELGIDTLIAGTGNDYYIVDSTIDTIKESFNQGNNLVWSSVSSTPGKNLEELILFGSSGLSGTGNALDNLIMVKTPMVMTSTTNSCCLAMKVMTP